MSELLKLFNLCFLRKIIAFIFVLSSYANASLQDPKHLELINDLKYLLSAQETINYDDPKLQEILNKYNYDLFSEYKAFIEFDKSAKGKDDIAKAREFVSNKGYGNLASDETDPNKIIAVFLMILTSDLIHAKIDQSIKEEQQKEILEHLKIPLWLVLKYPDAMKYRGGRWAPLVNYNFSIKNLPEFKKFYGVLCDVTEGYWFNFYGSAYIDYFAHKAQNLEHISFTPNIVIEKNNLTIMPADRDQEGISCIEMWSYQGIWNRLKYKKLLEYFEPACNALSSYYENNYGLHQYAPYARSILIHEAYMQEDSDVSCTETNLSYEDSGYDDYIDYYKTIRAVQKHENNFDKLKAFAQKLSNKEKGYLLFYSIIKELDINFIKWLIDKRAVIDSRPMDETPLMASVRNQEVMKLLLDSGADITIKNRFGKNVLFYAVQFGSKETVEMLLKADKTRYLVNSKICSLEEIRANYPQDEYTLSVHPYKVADFTPLIYAKRYASQEVINLLIEYGATDGPADPEVIQEWIKLGPLDL